MVLKVFKISNNQNLNKFIINEKIVVGMHIVNHSVY